MTAKLDCAGAPLLALRSLLGFKGGPGDGIALTQLST